MSLSDVANALEKIKNDMFVGETLTLAHWAETELTSIQHYLIEIESNRLELNHLAHTDVVHTKRVAGMIANFVDMLAHTHMKQKERKIPLCWLANWTGVAKLRIVHEKIKQTKAFMNLIPENSRSVGSVKKQRSLIYITKQLRFDYPIFVKNKNVVGFDGHMDQIFRLLTLQGNHNMHCVIPIVGMGGIGKTTLARLVFNHCQAREHFNAFAWVTFSHDYSINTVLKTLAKEICYLTHIRDRLDQMQEVELRDIVSRLFMKQNKCLVVLDDVQSVKVWSELQMVFPKRASGLRILLTTRNFEVARHAGSLPIVEIQPLSDEQSSTLLHSMIFQWIIPFGCVERHMDEFVRNLAKKCYGLPLALKTLDFIVRHSSRSWSNLVECFEWESEPEGQACLDIMAISYKSLTNHWMQSCFLYISTFPIGISISVSKLVRLCIAEGFIPKCETSTLEATARCFIDELIQRCLIQVVERKGARGRVKKICMHPVIRDSCIRVARKEHVLNFISEGGTYEALSNAKNGNNCRMVLQTRSDKVKKVWNSSYFQEARTVLGFQQNFNVVAEKRMFSHFYLLRVLDLQNSRGLENVDLAIGKLEDPMMVLERLPELTHLILGSGAYKGSFMSCSEGGFPKLSHLEMFWKFISKGWRIGTGSMSCLEYLSVKNCYEMEEVPQEMYKLEKVKELHLLDLRPEVRHNIEKNALINPSKVRYSFR
ncbi:hypothetical protein LUZ60_004035 [Juncus effusus]|nr:hypothetical protein LUZ60_004035 [Juncus effusus]